MIYSLDNFYLKIDKHIRLVKAFTEIENLDLIIKSCRLKPYNFDYKIKYKKTYLCNEWYDEFGNLLTISKSKKIKISYNNIKLNNSYISTSDIYTNLDIKKIIKISKSFFIFYGKEEDSINDFIFITLVGIDNYLRSYIYYDNSWSRISSLYLGMYNMNILINNINTQKNFYVKNRKDFITPCKKGKAWISCLPPNEKLIKILDADSDIITNLLKGI